MNILIADDHQLYLDALSLLVTRRYPQAQIVLASNFDDLLKTATQNDDWAAFCIDLHMPGLNSNKGIHLLSKRYPSVPIIVITSSENPNDTQQALNAGALGYIVKSMKNEEIINALDLMLNHGISIHPAATKTELIQATDNSLTTQLTPRQREVLYYICCGAANKRIALLMDVSESTIKTHVRAILQTLNVTNRTEAVIKAKSLWPDGSIAPPQ